MLRYMNYEMVITWDYSMKFDPLSSAHTSYLLLIMSCSDSPYYCLFWSLCILLASTIHALALQSEAKVVS